MPDFLVQIFASPYLAGNSIDEGIEKARILWKEKSLASTMDLLGEELDSEEKVEEAITIYERLIAKLDKNSKYITVSVKPSSLGYLIDKEYYMKNLEKIIKLAYEKGIEVTLDMEDHSYTDATLQSYKELKLSFETLGTVLQTCLFRTQADIDELGKINARIRLCIGIYTEPSDIAFQKKDEMKEKMIEYTKTLIENGHFVAFATHDEKYINQMLRLAEEKNYTSENLEFQMLLGVPRKKIQNEIIEKGFVMRLYVPFATRKKDSSAYLKRRLANNPKMALQVAKNLLRVIFRKNA